MTKDKEKTIKKPSKRRQSPGNKKEAEYLQFIKWVALPEPLREPRTQKELAVVLRVDESSLSDWKKRDGFWDEVKKELRTWSKEKTPNVIMGLYRKAVRDGTAQEAKLWLQYIEDWIETQGMRTELSLKVKEARDVIRGLIGKNAKK